MLLHQRVEQGYPAPASKSSEIRIGPRGAARPIDEIDVLQWKAHGIGIPHNRITKFTIRHGFEAVEQREDDRRT